MDEIKKPEHLKKYIEKTYWMFVPLVILNYPFRWLAYVLDKVSILKVLEFVSILSILVAVYFYLTGLDDRQKEKHYQAWQVINAAQGKPGSGGRIDALQDLNKDGVSLEGVDVSEAHLRGIDLENAYLIDANLSGANLWGANLSGALLQHANLSEADLHDANLSGAKIAGANLSGAQLVGANLSGAILMMTNLYNANLYDANLSGAILAGANLSGASLRRTNLKNILGGESIMEFNHATIWEVKNPPEGFIEWAKEHGADVDGPFPEKAVEPHKEGR